MKKHITKERKEGKKKGEIIDTHFLTKKKKQK
jgi:hypothetical protein